MLEVAALIKRFSKVVDGIIQICICIPFSQGGEKGWLGLPN